MFRHLRWRQFLIFASAVSLLGIALFGAMKYTSRSGFCASCHEMTPMYKAWQQSGHAGVDCVKCHAEPGLAGYVGTKVKALGEVYYHITGSYKKPITINSETWQFSQRCLLCHENIKGSGKPHNSVHFQQQMPCTSCHRDMVHDPKSNRLTPSYSVCVKCHGEEMQKDEKDESR